MHSRGLTRRRREKRAHPTFYNTLYYLGSGSYGSIYEVGNSGVALKEHMISDNTNTHCDSWRKEYDMQRGIYDTCNTQLHPLHVGIVKPFTFSYAKRNEQKVLISQTDPQGATSCFFTMERVPGKADADRCFTIKLNKLLKSDCNLPSTTIPPYLFMGTLNPPNGHLSLDMIQGAQLVSLPHEAYSYCKTEGVAAQLLRAMFLSFFIIIENGFMPRDIEYVFNGRCDSTYCSILDFNEVSILRERAAYSDNYVLETDIAHVYIDLCGLRSSRDVNPEAPYDSPTPQWKFLCNPLISPYAFFDCVEAARTYGFTTFNLDAVIQEILSYVERRNFRDGGAITWEPYATEFSRNNYEVFDYKLQKYYIVALLETLERRGKSDIGGLLGMCYGDALTYLQKKLEKRTYVEDDWGFALDGFSVVPAPVENSALRLRQRRHSIRRRRNTKN